MHLTGLSLLVDEPERFRASPPAEAAVWHRPVGRLQELFDLSCADQLLQSPLNHQMLSVVSQSRRVAGSSYTWANRPIQPGFAPVIRQHRVADQLRSGSTLVFESLHRTWRPVGDFCRRISYELGVPVSANAYLTPQGSQGFAHHYDTHPVLIVQTAGSKTWQLHRPLYTDPLEHQPFGKLELSEQQWEQLRHGTPFLEAVLHPGDLLWIPRGWIHNGFATDEPSLHVSYSFAAVGKYWVAMELVKRLDRIEGLRGELPWGFAQDSDARAAVIDETVKLLAEAFSRPVEPGLSETLADAYAEFFLEPALAPVDTSIGPQPAPDAVFRVVAESVIRRSWQPDGQLRLHLAADTLTIPAYCASVLDRLLDEDGETGWTVRDLLGDRSDRPEFDESTAVDLVAELISHGIVRIDS